jgi:8-oxo-dGTP diphosphatase
MNSDALRTQIRQTIAAINPLDAVEADAAASVLAWIDSGAPLFRVVKPATPPQHLAVYFALLDDSDRSLMLVDHVKSQAVLLAGGHVDDQEDPRVSVVREADEELRLDAKFHDVAGDRPLFLSVTQTRGQDSHIDVTLWFVLAASRHQQLEADADEITAINWLPLDSTNWTAEHFDPHMARFVAKLTAALDVQPSTSERLRIDEEGDGMVHVRGHHLQGEVGVLVPDALIHVRENKPN